MLQSNMSSKNTHTSSVYKKINNYQFKIVLYLFIAKLQNQ